jgi:Phage tail tube protein, TTP
MSVTKTTGTQFAIGSTYGAAKAVTAISNASPAVATLEASHGVVPGDFIEISSSWDLANGRVFRVSAVASNDCTLEGFNALDTAKYPPGTGVGTAREITAWTTLSQITPAFSVAGGDQNFADTTFVTNLIRTQIPTDRNAITVTLPFFFDPTLAWFATVRTAADAAAPYAFRMIFPNGSRLVVGAYWSLRGVPTSEDSTLRDVVDLAFIGQPTVYST